MDAVEISVAVFTDNETIAISSLGEGDSDALKENLLEEIRLYREAASLPDFNGTFIGHCTLEVQPNAKVEMAKRILVSIIEPLPNYVIVAIPDGDYAVEIAETLQPILDREYGEESPVVLGIQAPDIISFRIA